MLNSLIGIIASSGAGGVANSYESIATVTVGSGGSASITFSSIPQTYTHLQMRINWYGANADQSILTTLNNVSTGNLYALHSLEGNGSSASASASASRNNFEAFYDGNNAGSSTNNKVGIFDLLDYTDTNKNKTMRLLWGADYNGSGKVVLASSLFASTNAITRIDLQPFSTSFAQHTKISLYGIKG
jgi:hypothetical protein